MAATALLLLSALPTAIADGPPIPRVQATCNGRPNASLEGCANGSVRVEWCMAETGCQGTTVSLELRPSQCRGQTGVQAYKAFLMYLGDCS